MKNVEVRKGIKVKMSMHLKHRLIGNGSADHALEFGSCEGYIEGYTDYNNVPKGHPLYSKEKLGPEVEVRWVPSNLRYSYIITDLTKL